MKTNIAKILGLGTVIAMVSAGSAFAAIATDQANVYSGPGTGFRILGSVMGGEDVNILHTKGNWCQVSEPGQTGWVRCSDLAEGYGNNTTLGLGLLNPEAGPPRAAPPYPQPEFTGPGGHVGPRSHLTT